jgi:hypothetical protein
MEFPEPEESHSVGKTALCVSAQTHRFELNQALKSRPYGDALPQLRASGLAAKVDGEHYPNGRFARLYNPEGNPLNFGSLKGGTRMHRTDNKRLRRARALLEAHPARCP